MTNHSPKGGPLATANDVRRSAGVFGGTGASASPYGGVAESDHLADFPTHGEYETGVRAPSVARVRPSASAHWVSRAGRWPPERAGRYLPDGEEWLAAPLSSTKGNQGGVPAAALRGGHGSNGTQAGWFTLSLVQAFSYPGSSIGFRCVIPSSITPPFV
ncbi:hypothetical protein ACFL5O_03375 [Myxococcota bacterium]